MTSENATAMRRLLSDRRFHFTVLGGVNTVFSYGVYVVVLARLSMGDGHRLDYVIATLTSWGISTVTSFLLQRLLVFRVSGTPWRDFGRFVGVTAGVATINLGLGIVAVELLGLTSEWDKRSSQLVITALLVVASYIAHRDFSFRRTADA